MLTIYLACLVFGGALVALSLLGSAFDADVDLDADADVDFDADVNADGVDDVDADLALGWLPIASLRFWTFLLAFGGLTGALLSWLGSLPAIAVAAIALAVGYASGLGITRAVHHLGTNVVGKGVDDEDFVGASGAALLPISRMHIGQVRVEIGGRLVDRSATTEDETPIDIDTPVLVYAVDDDGSLQVTRVPALPGGHDTSSAV